MPRSRTPLPLRALTLAAALALACAAASLLAHAQCNGAVPSRWWDRHHPLLASVASTLAPLLDRIGQYTEALHLREIQYDPSLVCALYVRARVDELVRATIETGPGRLSPQRHAAALPAIQGIAAFVHQVVDPHESGAMASGFRSMPAYE